MPFPLSVSFYLVALYAEAKRMNVIYQSTVTAHLPYVRMMSLNRMVIPANRTSLTVTTANASTTTPSARPYLAPVSKHCSYYIQNFPKNVKEKCF